MEIKVFSGEIERLKEMSKKVASSSSSVATFVSKQLPVYVSVVLIL